MKMHKVTSSPSLFAHSHTGRITENEVLVQIFALLGAGLGIAYGLDRWAGHDFPTLLVSADSLNLVFNTPYVI